MFSGLLLGLGVGVPAELEVDAPHAVGLLVQQHALVRVERRVEPEPALGRKVRRVHAHVGDQEAVAEHAALALLADQLAHAGARAVAGHHVVGLERVGAVGRLDRAARAWSACCATPTTLFFQRRSISGSCAARSAR